MRRLYAVTYIGLEGTVGASALDSLYIDASLCMSSVSANETYTQPMVEMYEIPVCWTNDACPTDGRYAFSSNVTFPYMSNDFLPWWDEANDWNTTIVVEIYYNDSSILVGRCTMDAIIQGESGFLYEDQTSLKDRVVAGEYGDFITMAALLAAFTCCFVCFISICHFCSKSDHDINRKEPLIASKEKNVESIPNGRWRQPLIQGMGSLKKIGQGVSCAETAKGKIMIVPNANATQQDVISDDDEESVGNINHQTTSESTLFNASLTFSDGDGTRNSSIDEYDAWSSVSDEGCHCMTLYEPPLEHLVSRYDPTRF